MKIKATMFAVLLTITVSLAGCILQDKKEEKMDYRAVEQFHKLMDQDIEGDKKSVNWDGKKAEVIEDMQDDSKILDGKGSSGPGMKINQLHWYFTINISDDYTVLSDEENKFSLKGKDWYLEILKIDFDEAKNSLSKNMQMKEITQDLHRTITEIYSDVSLYRGLIAVEDQIMAGYVFIMDDFFGNSYQITYSGIGNVRDIKSVSMNLFRSFVIKIE